MKVRTDGARVGPGEATLHHLQAGNVVRSPCPSPPAPAAASPSLRLLPPSAAPSPAAPAGTNGMAAGILQEMSLRHVK